ncbi:DUF1488 domain-containing protein [Vibrio splendidus]|uniref:DUF1488 domain-containing protein n=1 Tax=Vibrio lentus TaxID=136468 RepID=A0A4V5R9J6_9VIBR|nr:MULTISPECIES: DUF1488 domain-containing protein [Vibrio]MBO7913989.1 DUF1488 domain-containing protein [Vibrio sp. G41H]MBT9240950.1 DUF1488 domain-containing protein [Vibrio splendidus]MCC4785088.1 DUF1488 domain-containing protein [Vibrio lentus]MCC4858544.1 DUF1488 domain-containing protein [Vibrio lentus]MCF7493078.1 DUF1488 domain-containing protein [Vibrio sp. G-C-1]
MNQSILFPDIQDWDEENQSIIFPAQQSGALIECVMSIEELSRLAGKNIEEGDQALVIFSELRFDIEELAEELIEEEEYDSSNRIQIKVF